MLVLNYISNLKCHKTILNNVFVFIVFLFCLLLMCWRGKMKSASVRVVWWKNPNKPRGRLRCQSGKKKSMSHRHWWQTHKHSAYHRLRCIVCFVCSEAWLEVKKRPRSRWGGADFMTRSLKNWQLWKRFRRRIKPWSAQMMEEQVERWEDT